MAFKEKLKYVYELTNCYVECIYLDNMIESLEKETIYDPLLPPIKKEVVKQKKAILESFDKLL